LTSPGSKLAASNLLNASFNVLRAGLLKPIGVYRTRVSGGRDYFLFPNGQLRRELGQGHSGEERAERRAKRNADYASRRDYKRARAIE
jgi:hypothetical protein